MSENNRIIYLDYAKVICAFLVVFGHLFEGGTPIRNFIYSFHMPFFFLVSGMLDKNKAMGGMIIKYLRTIIIPSIFYIVVFVAISTPFYSSGIWHVNTDIGSTVEIGGVLDTLMQLLKLPIKGVILGNHDYLCNYVVWFLFVLFNCKCLMLLYRRVNQKIFLAVYAVLFILILKFHIKYFFIGATIISFPFYLFGNIYSQKIDNLIVSKNKWYFPALLFVITLTLSLANGRVSTVGVSMGQHSLFISMPLFYTTALAGSVMVLSLSQLIARPLSQIESLSMSLISILGFQAIFTRAYRNMIGFNQNIFASIFSASCIVFFCYMMHLFTMRYLPEVLGKKRK